MLRDLKRPTEALAAFDRALQLKPDFAEALSNRGLILQELDRFDEALAAYDRSLQLRPDLADTHANRGNALQELARHEEALAAYRRALEIKPGYEAIYLNESLSRLVLGDFERGWPDYEWRWKDEQSKRSQRMTFSRAAVGRRRIRSRARPSFSTANRVSETRSSSAATSRCLAERGARVVLRVQSSLRDPGRSTGWPAHATVAMVEALPGVRPSHCPLLSLPLAFATAT